MKWATLLSLVSKGQVTPRSVVRGPTTHQLWKFAAHVKGLSREFNLCYSCGAEIDRTANQCGQCDRLQEPPFNPDALLESRELAPRTAIQREIKPAGESTDLVVAGDDRARQRTPDDGILSAKELAAAFQLDFNPQSSGETPEIQTPPARPRSRAKVLVMLMLLAAITGSAILYAKPDYRAKASAWLHDQYDWARTSIAAANSKPAPKPLPWEATPANPEPASAQIEPAPSPAPTSEITPETSKEKDKSVPPEPEPAVVNVNPAPAPAPEKQAMPEPEKPHRTPQIAEQIEDLIKAPIPSDVKAQEELGKKLYNAGIDADRLQDFKLSIRCYERIKQLDPSAQPTATDVRLAFAKEYAPK